MGLAYDFVIAGVILTISVVIHLIAVYLFAPGTALHSIASGATLMNGAKRADLWYQILAMWMPLGGVLVSFTWPLIRSYRRQANTAVAQMR